MLGWHISVYKQTENVSSAATETSSMGLRLAVWQVDLDGLSWIHELVRNGKAVNLGGNGYPYRYTITAKQLIPQIINTPPDANEIWTSGPDDILDDKWAGKTMIDRSALQNCHQDEWLIIEAWDES